MDRVLVRRGGVTDPKHNASWQGVPPCCHPESERQEALACRGDAEFDVGTYGLQVSLLCRCLTILGVNRVPRNIDTNSRLVAQLVGLERRTARGGRDTIDHAPGGHDDLINAAAGVLCLATTKAPGCFVSAIRGAF